MKCGIERGILLSNPRRKTPGSEPLFRVVYCISIGCVSNAGLEIRNPPRRVQTCNPGSDRPTGLTTNEWRQKEGVKSHIWWIAVVVRRRRGEGSAAVDGDEDDDHDEDESHSTNHDNTHLNKQLQPNTSTTTITAKSSPTTTAKTTI